MIPITHGHGHDRARLHLCFFIHFGEKSGVLTDVGHNHSFIILRHPAGNPLAHLDTHILQRLRAFADRQLKIEFLLHFIEEQERPGVRPQKLIDFFHDCAQNLIELERGGESLAKFVEHRDFARFALLSTCRNVAAPLDSAEIFGLAHLAPLVLCLAGRMPFHGETNAFLL